QRAIVNRAAVQDDVVADGAVGADDERKAEIGVAGRAVLHVRAFADLDPFIVAAQDGAGPDPGAGPQPYAADHSRGLRDEIIAVGGKVGRLPVKLVNRHEGLLLRTTLAQRDGGFQATATRWNARRRRWITPEILRRGASSERRCRSSCSRSLR